MSFADIFLLHHAVESQIFPCFSLLHLVVGNQILPLHKWSGESNLTATSCSRETNLTGEKCSWELKGKISGNISPPQYGVKSKNFGRLPRPLKGQLCHKSHMGDLHYPIPKRITY
jgi:hypothetical protein